MPNIRVSHEAERGCGFRKIGGYYLIGGIGGYPCKRFPIPVGSACSCCGRMWKQVRSMETEIDLDVLLRSVPCTGGVETCAQCPMMDTKYGEGALMWVGEKFYDPEEFVREAHKMGVSRRIPENKVSAFLEWVEDRGGETPYVALAHPQAIDSGPCGRCSVLPGVGDKLVFADGGRVAEVRFRSDRMVGFVHEDDESRECSVELMTSMLRAGEVSVVHERPGKIENPDKPGSWIKCPSCDGRGRDTAPGIFQVFKPSAIEYVVDRRRDTEEKWTELEERGVKLVEVIPVKDDRQQIMSGVTDPPKPKPVLDANGITISVGDAVEPAVDLKERWAGHLWHDGSTAKVLSLDQRNDQIRVRITTPGRDNFEGWSAPGRWIKA